MQTGVPFPTLYFIYFFSERLVAGFAIPLRAGGGGCGHWGSLLHRRCSAAGGEAAPGPGPGPGQLPSVAGGRTHPQGVEAASHRTCETSRFSLSPLCAALSAPRRAAGSPSAALKSGRERYVGAAQPQRGWEVTRPPRCPLLPAGVRAASPPPPAPRCPQVPTSCPGRPAVGATPLRSAQNTSPRHSQHHFFA